MKVPNRSLLFSSRKSSFTDRLVSVPEKGSRIQNANANKLLSLYSIWLFKTFSPFYSFSCCLLFFRIYSGIYRLLPAVICFFFVFYRMRERGGVAYSVLTWKLSWILSCIGLPLFPCPFYSLCGRFVLRLKESGKKLGKKREKCGTCAGRGEWEKKWKNKGRARERVGA